MLLNVSFTNSAYPKLEPHNLKFPFFQRGLGRGRRLLLLVALLLLLFGTIANGQDEYKVGFGKHVLRDGKVHLAPDWDKKDNYNCHVKMLGKRLM